MEGSRQSMTALPQRRRQPRDNRPGAEFFSFRQSVVVPREVATSLEEGDHRGKTLPGSVSVNPPLILPSVRSPRSCVNTHLLLLES